MHLLIDGTSLSIRLKGVGRFTYEACRRLKAQLPPDWRITLLVFDQELPGEVASFGMTLHSIPRCKESVLGLITLPRVLKQLQPNLFLRPADAIGYRYKVPTLTVCHDIDALIHAVSDPIPVSRRLTNRLRFFAKRRGLRASQRILCVSDYIRERIPETYGISAKRCATLYCGVDSSRVPTADDSEVQSITDQYGSFVMGIATGDSRENALCLPPLFREARDAGYPGRLIIVGVDPSAPFAAQLRSALAAQNLKLPSDVILLPFFDSQRYEELLRHFAAADFYIETSRHEAFGLQLLEAMACGTCCLSTGAGSLREIGGGFPIEYSSAHPERAGEILADAWRQGRHQQVSQAQIDHCRSFTWERCAADLAGSLLEVSKMP